VARRAVQGRVGVTLLSRERAKTSESAVGLERETGAKESPKFF
jgi:hypothetical protein